MLNCMRCSLRKGRLYWRKPVTMQQKNKDIDAMNMLEEHFPKYGLVTKSEEEKLREDIFRPDIEKLRLFTRMLRRNTLLNKAIITHTR